MRSRLPILMLMLALAGCDKDASEAERKVQTLRVGVTNAFQQQMEALSPVNRGLALRRAVQDSGELCKRVTASAYQGDYKALKMWTLRCSDSGDWGLFLAANGDVQVRACKDMLELGLPPCVTGPLEADPEK